MATRTLLSIKDLGYGTPDGRPLIQGLSVELHAGQLLAVTGPNGTGKSTMLRVVLGELAPLAGQVYVHTQSVFHLAQLQNREFHIPMTLADVLAVHTDRPFKRQDALAVGLLSERELNLAWNTASGGERQKTLLTKAFMAHPELLILDEPTNHLDAGSRQKLCQLLRQYTADGTRGVVVICHETLLIEGGLQPATVLDLAKFSGA